MVFDPLFIPITHIIYFPNRRELFASDKSPIALRDNLFFFLDPLNHARSPLASLHPRFFPPPYSICGVCRACLTHPLDCPLLLITWPHTLRCFPIPLFFFSTYLLRCFLTDASSRSRMSVHFAVDLAPSEALVFSRPRLIHHKRPPLVLYLIFRPRPWVYPSIFNVRSSWSSPRFSPSNAHGVRRSVGFELFSATRSIIFGGVCYSRTPL